MAAPTAKEAQSFASFPVPVKLLLGILIGAIFAGVYYFALHTPLVTEIEEADGMHQQLRQQLSQAEERQREYLRVRAELDGRAAIDRQNKRILPERAEIPAFLQDLNRLAELSGLRLELVEPRPDEVDVQYVKIPVSLAFSGRYHQVAKFFFNVSQLDRAISMENVRLTEPTVVGEEITVKVAVLATTFRRPTAAEASEDAAATAAAPAAPAAPREALMRKLVAMAAPTFGLVVVLALAAGCEPDYQAGPPLPGPPGGGGATPSPRLRTPTQASTPPSRRSTTATKTSSSRTSIVTRSAASRSSSVSARPTCRSAG